MTADTHPVTTALRALGRLYPGEVQPSEELRLAVAFLDLDTGPETLVRAGYVGGAAVGLAVASLALLAPASYRLTVALAAVTLGLLTTHTVQAAPRLWATARRTSALGAAPDLVARTVLSMRLTPTPERAAEFTARTGEGLLAASHSTPPRRASRRSATRGPTCFPRCGGRSRWSTRLATLLPLTEHSYSTAR
jgi:hypothetical protein